MDSLGRDVLQQALVQVGAREAGRLVAAIGYVLELIKRDDLVCLPVSVTREPGLNEPDVLLQWEEGVMGLEVRGSRRTRRGRTTE